MLADHLVDDVVDAEARLVGHLDEAVLDQRLGQPGDDVVPPGHIDRVILERHEVLGRDRDVRRRHRGDRALGHVDGHGDAVVLRRVADLLGLEDAARGQQVGVDHRDAALEQRLEAFLEVDVLAGADRHRGRFLQLPVLVGVLPGDHVLEPGRHVLLDPLGEPDAVLQRDVADVVDGERNLVADDLANLVDVLLEQVDALLGEIEPGEGMADVVDVVDRVALRAGPRSSSPGRGRDGRGSLRANRRARPPIRDMSTICISPRSILRKVKPRSMRSLRRLPVSVPLGCSASVSQ